jgi:hypothetical protein
MFSNSDTQFPADFFFARTLRSFLPAADKVVLTRLTVFFVFAVAVVFFLAVFLRLAGFLFIAIVQILPIRQSHTFESGKDNSRLHFYGHVGEHMISKSFQCAPVAQLDRATDF